MERPSTLAILGRLLLGLVAGFAAIWLPTWAWEFATSDFNLSLYTLVLAPFAAATGSFLALYVVRQRSSFWLVPPVALAGTAGAVFFSWANQNLWALGHPAPLLPASSMLRTLFSSGHLALAAMMGLESALGALLAAHALPCPSCGALRSFTRDVAKTRPDTLDEAQRHLSAVADAVETGALSSLTLPRPALPLSFPWQPLLRAWISSCARCGWRELSALYWPCRMKRSRLLRLALPASTR